MLGYIILKNKKYGSSTEKFIKRNSVDKEYLATHIYNKLNGLILKQHIHSVVELFVEEFIAEILSKKRILINNFGYFIVQKFAPRRHFDVWSKKMTMSEGNNRLKFYLYQKISHAITSSLDLEKTFGTNEKE